MPVFFGGTAMKTIIKRFVRLLIGLCVMSFGSAMALVADLGM